MGVSWRNQVHMSVPNFHILIEYSLFCLFVSSFLLPVHTNVSTEMKNILSSLSWFISLSVWFDFEKEYLFLYLYLWLYFFFFLIWRSKRKYFLLQQFVSDRNKIAFLLICHDNVWRCMEIYNVTNVHCELGTAKCWRCVHCLDSRIEQDFWGRFCFRLCCVWWWWG